MAKNEHLRGVVSLAAAKAEAIVRTYPTHFYDIEEAKSYVDATCKRVDFEYITSKHISDEELEYVKDKACFAVAARAFKQGEFYLKVELADPRALRGGLVAVEADINRLLPLVPYWPLRFSNVQEAVIHVDGVARWSRFAYKEFEGVEGMKFRSYVNSNTVRHAFEAGRFDLDVPGKGWQCRQPKPREQAKKVVTLPKTHKGRLATMREAVEFDMQRLLPLLSAWPATFHSLNAARDHVRVFSRSIHFSYTYWPNVEPSHFRLIANFHTAKRAFNLGKFNIDPKGETGDESDDTEKTAVDEKSEVSTLAYDLSSIGTVGTPLFSATTAYSNSINSIGTAITNTTAVDTATDTVLDLVSDEPSSCAGNIQEVAQEVTMPPVVEVDEDPFKDLVAILKRESILKMAFE
ncbi:hypothetical protein G6011_03288 [Alternaria panax]|uniref:Uncharacterized protein n=1 Tax=Alternaria panax TaxID=48097 RepID=A0AAD4NSH8_9PLEO|nr:hypothetical protein G6011_03288 [Alternaria panax]